MSYLRLSEPFSRSATRLLCPGVFRDSAQPALLALHGCGGLYAKGGALSSRYRETAETLHAAGYAVLMPNPRGSEGQGSAFTGSLKFRYLSRLVVQDGRVVREERLLTDLGQRVRDVREGPDGLLYLLTDDRNGRLLRVVPGG